MRTLPAAKSFPFVPKLQRKASLTIQTVNHWNAVFLPHRFPSTITMKSSGWQVPDDIITRILLLRGMFNIHHLHALLPLKCNMSLMCFKNFHINHRLNFSNCQWVYYLQCTNLFAITHLSRPGINFHIDWSLQDWATQLLWFRKNRVPRSYLLLLLTKLFPFFLLFIKISKPIQLQDWTGLSSAVKRAVN